MTRNGNTKRQLAKLGLSAVALAAFCGFSPSSAYADCTGPVGVAGDMIYNNSYNLMQYCNGSSWINMSSVATVAYGTLTPGDFCTAISTNQIACTTATINLSTQASGTLQAAQFPALTGDVTTTAGSLATTIGTNKVTLTKLAQISGLSVLGNAGSSTGNVTAITGTANQVLMVNSAGTSLGFGALDLANAVTGILTPAHGGTGVNNGTNTITLTGNLSTTGGYAINLAATGATNVTLPTSGTLTAGTGTANYTARWTGTNTLGTGALYDNGTAVGIGTTAPVVALDLSAKTDAFALPVGTTGTRPTGANLINGEIRYNNTSSNIEAYINGAWTSLLSASGAGTDMPAAGSDGYVQFNASNKLAGDGNLFWDNSNKRLGIGNSSPSYPLQVTGTASADIFRAASGSAAAPSLTPGGTAGLFSPSASALGISAGGSERIRIAADGKVGIGTTTPGASLTVVGSAALPFGTDYATTGTQSSVSLLSNVSVRYTGAAASTFNGIAAGTDGQIITLHNASNYTLTLANQSTSESTAANRIITGTGGNFPMTANSSAILQYDGTAARWRVIGGSASGTPAGTTGQVQFNSGSNTFAANANFTWTDAISQLVIGTGAATAANTTGTVSSVVMNVIPQAVSPTYGGGTIGGVALGSATAGQVAYYSGATSISGSPMLYVSGSGVGIGTAASATLPLTVYSSTQGGLANFVGDGTTDAGVNVFSYGTASGAGFVGIAARGTQSAPTISQSGDRLAYLLGAAYTGTATVNVGAISISMDFNSTPTATSMPTIIKFDTTSVGTTKRTERMRIDSSGNVGIGTTLPMASLDLSAKTDAVILPVGTTGARPAGANGMMRYNSTTSGVEAYVNGGWASLMAASASSLVNVQTFTASGTYTPTAGATKAIVIVTGAGGSGGGGRYGYGGAGGGGCTTIGFVTSLSSVSVVVGAGGAPVSGRSTGNTGGTSSFGSISASGGFGGGGSSDDNGGSYGGPGEGGSTSSGGMLTIPGSKGSGIFTTTTHTPSQAVGGAIVGGSFWGQGPWQAYGSAASATYGLGGSPGYSSTYASGAGSKGVVVVIELAQ